MPQDFTYDQSILVQVMAWGRQATSHYLSQCWPKSLSPYGIIRPQWVKHGLTHWPLGDLTVILNKKISNLFYWMTYWEFNVKLFSYECHRDIMSTVVQVMAWCHQAASHYLSLWWPSLYRHMVSLAHNELTHIVAWWRQMASQNLVIMGFVTWAAPSHYPKQSFSTGSYLRTKLHGIWVKITKFNFQKIHLKMLSAKLWPFCSALNTNSLWPINTIWQQKSGSTLAQCLTAISHYLNHCWLNVGDIVWYVPEGNCIGYAQDIYPWYEFENYKFNP